MRYTYTAYERNAVSGGVPRRVDVTTRIEEIVPETFYNNCFVEVYDNLKSMFVQDCHSYEDLELWFETLERNAAWKPHIKEPKVSTAIKDHINPSHYQSYMTVSPEVDLQWLEAMQYLPHFKEPRCFLAAVELQVRKYLDRSGGKDEELQETKKALWYLKFMIAYMENNYSPIRVKDIK